ncbi:hypothetical protein [Rhizobium leguminosarum]|uniref:hypothetical protein n=1 Tax=Rhizobium leguminosarum TaxID=384 RepID=UPI0014415820|nr:hypothetical protein [Rhizobium leguminosarum]MBY5867464.1 hypothetical protein [Rhizobium leguminosarum]NKM05288.1 hypothetical protein [Rhizobium leguminosarum bv. viciae]
MAKPGDLHEMSPSLRDAKAVSMGDPDDLSRIGSKSESASQSKNWSMMSPENRSHFSASCAKDISYVAAKKSGGDFNLF